MLKTFHGVRKLARRNWTRPEQALALELYLRTPFGRIHKGNKEIIELATTIGRSPSALSLKMANFSALDPTIHQKGMGNYSKADAQIWSEFFAAPSSFLSNIPKANLDYEQKPILPPNFDFEVKEGKDIVRTVKTRKNQGYFRKMLLVSYDGKCALTGIGQKELLNASHIKPWSVDKESRLDPRNGILLNALHDRAFDKGFITFEDDLSLVVSKHLDLPELSRPFFEDKALRPPERFAPNPAFLTYHRENEFEKFLR